jgi:hypothetical protein
MIAEVSYSHHPRDRLLGQLRRRFSLGAALIAMQRECHYPTDTIWRHAWAQFEPRVVAFALRDVYLQVLRTD